MVLTDGADTGSTKATADFAGEARGIKPSLPRKRPHLYISSDSEDEDDIPLRKAKPSLRTPNRKRGEVQEASPAKRVKLDPVSSIYQEEGDVHSGTTSRGKGTKTSKVKKKKGAGDSKTDGPKADELSQAPETVKTTVAQHKAQDVNTSMYEETRTASKKRGTAANARVASEEERVDTGNKAPTKRHDAGTDPGDEEEGDAVPGQPAGREAKRRRKADGQPDVAVPYTINSSLEAKDRNDFPRRDEHKA